MEPDQGCLDPLRQLRCTVTRVLGLCASWPMTTLPTAAPCPSRCSLSAAVAVLRRFGTGLVEMLGVSGLKFPSLAPDHC